MDTYNKNIIYTYIPPEIDWECNKDFYLIDLICMLYSVKLFKNKFKYKKIILYTSTELKDFFQNNDYFDEVFDIEDNKEHIKEQIQGICAKHTIFKVIAASKQTEPFIHIDGDFIINDDTLFSTINKPILFSFIENIFTNESATEKDGYYELYFNAFKKTISVLDENEWAQLGKFNTNNAANCSIFGSEDDSLCRSFKRAWDFFINNQEKLIKVKDINLALEQYYQFSFLLEEKSFFNDIFTLDDSIKTGYISNPEHDQQIRTCNEYDELDINIYLKVKEHFTKSKVVHLSGMRWTLYYKILICSLLRDMDNKILDDIKETFGYYKWIDYKIE